MRYLLAGAVGLALLAPAWADDKPATDKAPVKAKTTKEQIGEITQAFQREMGELQTEFQSAKTQEDKEKVRDKALNHVSFDFAKKMLAVAVANPKDPAVVDALVFVCVAPGEPAGALAPEALKIMLNEHAGSDQLVGICQALARRDDGDKLIRDIRAKSTNKVVQLQAGFFLAEALREKDEPTDADNTEAEKLLVDFVAAAKDRKDVPEGMLAAAESSLKDLRIDMRMFGIGKPAPVAESKDLDDKAVKLADYKGKVVVLDFWATWCPPCRGMIPHERELVKKNAGKPFVFISVSADEKKDDLTKFLKDEPMPWVHWFGGATGGVVADWNIHAFPTMYVIDAKGVIRGKIRGGGPKSEKRLDEFVEKLVKEADGKAAN